MNKRFRTNIHLILCSVLVVGTLGILGGCSSSDDGGDVVSGPSGIAIQLDAQSARIGETVSAEASFITSRADAPDCEWYVNGVLGGSAEDGTITQENPAVYTAPDAVPALGIVEIKAVTDDDDAFEDVVSLTIDGPSNVLLDFSAWELQVAAQIEVSASFSWRRDLPGFDWYVNDELGGNSMSGMITQTNPAVYTAPSVVPQGDTIQIKAVYPADPSLSSQGTVRVMFTIKHVDAVNGTDFAGGGSAAYPLRTISFALDEAESGDTILVAPGDYNPDHEDDASFMLGDSITLRGEDRDDCWIHSDPDAYNSIWIGDGATIEHFSIGNLGTINIGIQSVGTCTIRSIYFEDGFGHSAIRIANDGNETLVEDCTLMGNGDPEFERGMEIIDASHATVLNTTVTGWGYGIMVTEAADPLIQGCTVTNNESGVLAFSEETNPDLGGGARGSLGLNTIRDNQIGLNHRSDFDVWAKFNTWTTNPPTQGPPTPCDYYLDGEGIVIWF